MKKSAFSAIVAAALLTSASVFAAGVTSTTTWTDEQGNVIREYSTTKHYAPITDPKIEVREGVDLPQSVTLYDLPDTIRIQQPDRYRYVIVTGHTLVVERDSRRVIHVW